LLGFSFFKLQVSTGLEAWARPGCLGIKLIFLINWVEFSIGLEGPKSESDPTGFRFGSDFLK